MVDPSDPVYIFETQKGIKIQKIVHDTANKSDLYEVVSISREFVQLKEKNLFRESAREFKVSLGTKIY